MIFVGRIVANKAQDKLIEVFVEYCKKFEDKSSNTNDEDYQMELYEKPQKFHKFDQIKKDKKHMDAFKPNKKI